METIVLNDREYFVKKGEFTIKPHDEYNNLKIYPKVGELERIIGLLNDLTEHTKDTSISIYGWNYGGFLPIGCSKVYKNVFVYTDETVLSYNLPNNIVLNQNNNEPFVVCAIDNDTELSSYTNSYILCKDNQHLSLKDFMKFKLNRSNYYLYVPIMKFSEFYKDFWYYLDEDRNLNYDNLIHLCVMVKNGGKLFEKMLEENLPIIDRWTILDTGSTDGTQEVARRVLAKKKGQLYEEPFINFRESRNKCLDLAGKNCKYNLMLDDTYVIKKGLREFLNTVRGDQFASSFSLLILSDDVETYSNRVTLSEKEHRYVYRIHEVIQLERNTTNVVIPKEASYIFDYRAEYMEKRTMDRKRYDLEQLYLMVEEDPTNPRHYYYLAQTYNLLEDYENACYWFKRRATTTLEGHIQEAVDSWFEYGRIMNFKLNKPWKECKAAYEEAYKLDPSRPDPLYFIGIHYYLKGDKKTSYEYFKKAFELGYPIHAQFSLKPTLTYHFLPKFLTQLCYEFKNWELGYQSCRRFLENNKSSEEGYNLIVDWFKIFSLLIQLPKNNPVNVIGTKPKVVFVVDGGWAPWTGSDILNKGMGGSETYIVEIARWIQASNKYDCVVFCNCSKEEEFEGVKYMSLEKYPEYLSENIIDTIIVSRYSEYIPLSLEGNVINNVYLILHDLGPTGSIIPLSPKLKKILCLTDWHVDFFSKNFPTCKNFTESFYYGIDNNLFRPAEKVKNSFIYSSFPNRGLLPLIQMWPKIKEAIPDATLNVYSDINGKWVNEVAKETMTEIRKILENKLDGVTVYGWVSKNDLAKAWSKADIWLYPNTFQETFCLTALEAAATKTLAIGPHVAALQETIGDRGIIINGNPLEQEWQDRAIKALIEILNDDKKKNELIERNYNWASGLSWKQRGEEFMKRYLDNDLTDNDLNFADMYNWTHDLPEGGGHKKLFEEALSKINPKHILEIGTFAGTSLIHMLRLYPNAKGVAIDTWKKYVEDDIISLSSMEENIFYQNVNKAGMTNRITAMKGDSVSKLCELIEAGNKFDFIYVDGSHKCLDCYADMVLAWQLLDKGGVLAVDDIMYNYKKVASGDLLGYPLKAKEHFMEKYKGQYEIISDSYRLFISKV